MNDEIQRYVAEHREDLHYTLKEGDRWTRTIVIAALIEAGRTEVELAKQELEQQSGQESSWRQSKSISLRRPGLFWISCSSTAAGAICSKTPSSSARSCPVFSGS